MGYVWSNDSIHTVFLKLASGLLRVGHLCVDICATLTTTQLIHVSDPFQLSRANNNDGDEDAQNNIPEGRGMLASLLVLQNIAFFLVKIRVLGRKVSPD